MVKGKPTAQNAIRTWCQHGYFDRMEVKKSWIFLQPIKKSRLTGMVYRKIGLKMMLGVRGMRWCRSKPNYLDFHHDSIRVGKIQNQKLKIRNLILYDRETLLEVFCKKHPTGQRRKAYLCRDCKETNQQCTKIKIRYEKTPTKKNSTKT